MFYFIAAGYKEKKDSFKFRFKNLLFKLNLLRRSICYENLKSCQQKSNKFELSKILLQTGYIQILFRTSVFIL